MTILDYTFILFALGWAICFNTIMNTDSPAKRKSSIITLIIFVIMMTVVVIAKSYTG